MKRTTKTIILSIALILLFTGTIFVFYFQQPNSSIKAQKKYPSTFICDEPIPIGEIIEESIDFLNEIYQQYQQTYQNLHFAITNLTSAISLLEKNPEEICDFSQCVPEVKNRGLSLYIETELGKTKISDIPHCTPEQCSGKPCPVEETEKYLKELKKTAKTIKGNYQTLTDLLTQKIPLPENLKIIKTTSVETETEQTTTKLEQIRRKLTLARLWLHPTSEQGKRSCVLTELERKKAKAGEILERFPMKCVEALEQGIYWPKPWSEKCEDLCPKENGEKLTNNCKSCLGKPISSNSSPLAKINYKIYNQCASLCENGLNQECLNCICCEEFTKGICSKPLSEFDCISFLCGGSYYNWVCCRGKISP